MSALSCLLALGLAARAAEPAPAPRETVPSPWGELPRPDAEPPEPGPGSPVGGGDVQPVPYLMAALGDSIMALDCFHPNRAAQERIAAELWRDQPWFR